MIKRRHKWTGEREEGSIITYVDISFSRNLIDLQLLVLFVSLCKLNNCFVYFCSVFDLKVGSSVISVFSWLPVVFMLVK